MAMLIKPQIKLIPKKILSIEFSLDTLITAAANDMIDAAKNKYVLISGLTIFYLFNSLYKQLYPIRDLSCNQK